MANVVQNSGSSRVSVQITGMADIDRKLAELPLAIRGRELEKAGTKAIGRIEKRAEQLVPIGQNRTGKKKDKKHLKATIGKTMRRYQGGAVLAWYTGPEYPAGAHGHLVEHGTAPHDITTKSGKTYQHPGAKPHQFMGPAVADVAPQIEADIIEALDKAIDKVIRSG